MRYLVIFYSLILSVSFTKACDLESLLKGTYYHEELASSGLKIFDRLSAVKAELITGEQVPKWEDIEDLNSLVVELETLSKRYKFPSADDELAFYHRLFLEHPEAKKILELLKEKIQVTVDYDKIQLGHLELIHYYRELFKRLEVFLPEKLTLTDLKMEERREKLVLAGEEMVRKQEEFFKEMFKETEFVDFATYQARLAEKKAELGEEALKTVQEGDMLISMRRPESARWWVPKVGFQNQRISQSSKGTFDNAWRTKAEAIHTNNDLESFSKLDWDLMPKYGFVETKNFKMGEDAAQYGEDIYLFDPRKVERRLSFTVRDSLGLARDTNSSVRTRFIPWENRELIASTEWFKKMGGTSIESSIAFDTSRYVEAQYFGPLRLDDVTTFIFKKFPPEGEFLQELLSRHIEILDGRGKDVPIKWEVPASEVPSSEATSVTDFKPYE